MSHHLVGMAEIAEMLGVSRQRVAQLVESYADFPQPEAELTSGRVWSRTAVETWIATHPNRGPGRPETRDRPRRRRKRTRDRGPVSFTRFTDRAKRAVVKAQEEARLLNHNYIGTEHILLGLLSIGEGLAWKVLSRLEVSVDVVRERIREMVGVGSETPTGHIPFTPRSKKVLELALREALSLSHNYIGTEHVLLAIVREGEGVASQILVGLGLNEKELRRAVLDEMQGYASTSAAPREESLLTRLERLEVRVAELEDREEE